MRFGHALGGSMLALVAGHASVLAEDQIIEPGDRVRVDAPATHPQPIVGKLREQNDGSLIVRDMWSGDHEIPLNAITGLDVAVRSRSKARQGAVIGGLVGLGTAVLFVVVVASGDALLEAEDAIGVYAVGGAAVGAGLGALVGWSIREVTWKPVPIGELRVGTLSRPNNALGVVVATTF